MPGWHSASSVCSPQAGGGNCFLGVQRPSCAFRGIWLVGRSLGYCGRHWLGLPPAPAGCDVSAAQHLPSWQESPSWSGIDCVCEISLLSLHMKGEMFRSSASFSNIFFIFCNYFTWNIVTAIGYFTALMVNAKQPSNNTARNLICKAVSRFVHSIRKSDSFVWGTIVRFSDGVYTTFDSRFRANIYEVFLVMELNDFHVMCIVFGSEKSETKDCAWSEKKKKKSLCRARIFKRYFLSSVPTCCERKKIGRLFGWYPYSVYPTFYSGLVNNL